MSLTETLSIVIDALDRAGVPFMVAGSMASGFHGETRSTQDIDMVVDPVTADALDAFVGHLDTDRFYVNDHRQAFDQRGMFNVIDTTNGWKVDLIVRHNRPFSVEEFARRREANVAGVHVYIASAEDVVLSKLEWAAESGSERQLDDARAVIRSSGSTMDRAYLERWAKRLNLAETLSALLEDE